MVLISVGQERHSSDARLRQELAGVARHPVMDTLYKCA